jgi:hypothetical protein
MSVKKIMKEYRDENDRGNCNVVGKLKDVHENG